jgi:hypothetical protein
MVLTRRTIFRRGTGMQRLQKNFPPFHPPPSQAPLYSSPSLPPRGRARDRLDHVGRERRPRRSGPARRFARRETDPPVPGVPVATPPALRPERPSGLKKRGMETFRRRAGAPVRRH